MALRDENRRSDTHGFGLLNGERGFKGFGYSFYYWKLPRKVLVNIGISSFLLGDFRIKGSIQSSFILRPHPFSSFPFGKEYFNLLLQPNKGLVMDKQNSAR